MSTSSPAVRTPDSVPGVRTPESLTHPLVYVHLDLLSPGARAPGTPVHPLECVHLGLLLDPWCTYTWISYSSPGVRAPTFLVDPLACTHLHFLLTSPVYRHLTSFLGAPNTFLSLHAHMACSAYRIRGLLCTFSRTPGFLLTDHRQSCVRTGGPLGAVLCY